MKITALWILMALFAFSCQTKSLDTLPIMGNKGVVEKEVDGKMVIDTVYQTIPDFIFTDQDNQTVSQQRLENKVYVADFFFTTCPTICPAMKRNLLLVYKQYKDNDTVAILSHTIDPVHDSVAVLKDYATRLGVTTGQWYFVTGAKDSIFQIAQSYLVSAQEDEYAAGGLIHSGHLVLVDKQKRIRGLYDGTEEKDAKKLIRDISILLKEE